MLSQNIEAVHSATYVENYLESVENLPDDVQKYLSRIREIDVQYRGYLRDLDHCMSNHKGEQHDSVIITAEKTRFMNKIQKNLIAAQELGDEKLQIVNQLQELIDHKTRQLDHDFKNLDYGKDEPMAIIPEIIAKEIRAPSPAVILPAILTNNSATVQPVLTTTTTSVSVSSVIAAVIAPVVLPSSAVISSNSTSTTSTNISTASNNNERSSKRVRRTRTDTGTGIEIITPEIPSVAVAVEPPPVINKPIVTQSTANVIQKKGTGSGKKKKRKTRGTQGNGGNNNQSNARETRDDTPPVEEPIDPDEPTYCLCDQISFGEMILCDNDLCPIEWFHFSCVSLMSKPKGKWFCPNCRGDRPNVMKPKAQFLKELERYNKEKEEKT